jgi:hypothetical protein
MPLEVTMPEDKESRGWKEIIVTGQSEKKKEDVQKIELEKKEDRSQNKDKGGTR